jgi:hypothetical protein
MDITLPLPQLTDIWGAPAEGKTLQLTNPLTGQVVEI